MPQTNYRKKRKKDLDKLLEHVRAGRFPLANELSQRLWLGRKRLDPRGASGAASLRSATASDDQEPNDHDYLRLHSLRFEVLDQTGRHEDALVVINVVLERCRNRLSKPPAKFYRETVLLWRQCIMCLLAGAYGHYRLHNLIEAKKLLEHADAALKLLVPIAEGHSIQLSGTRARYHYYLAQILRSERKYTESLKNFDYASDCSANRLKNKLSVDSNSQMLLTKSVRESEIRFARHCQGKLQAFGYGWCAMHLGQLKVALTRVQEAYVSLFDSEDEHLKNHAQLLAWSIRRSMRGADVRLQDDHLPYLKVLLKDVREHEIYRIRVLAEIVSTCMFACSPDLLGETSCTASLIDEASETTVELHKLAERRKWKEMHIYARIFQAKLERWRREPERAKSICTEELQKLKASETSLELKLRLALAEVLIDLGDLNEAWDCLSRPEHFSALGESTSLRASYHLHLAEICVRNRDSNRYKDAGEHWHRWQELRPNVEAQWLHQQAARIFKLFTQRLYLVPDLNKPDILADAGKQLLEALI